MGWKLSGMFELSLSYDKLCAARRMLSQRIMIQPPNDLDLKVNDFATRTFRNTADCDYIGARILYRAKLDLQFLWSGLQAIEKYLKCILVFNRVPVSAHPRDFKTHDAVKLLDAFLASNTFNLKLSNETGEFLQYINHVGPNRYFQFSYQIDDNILDQLDRAVWEVRRYARYFDYYEVDANGNITSARDAQLALNDAAELNPQNFRIDGGHLESVIANPTHPSHEALVWRNCYYGDFRADQSASRGVSIGRGANSPLYLNPNILDEVKKYVHL
jgi:hypothetical protein